MKFLRKNIRLSLRAKLTLLIESFIIVIVVITGIITTMREKQTLEQELTRRGFALASDLAQFSVRPIINQDLPTLRRFVNHTMEQDYVLYAIVLDPQGNVLMHSDLDEVNKTYNDSLSVAAVNSQVPGFTQIDYEKRHNDIDLFMPILIGDVRLGTVRLGYSHMAVEQGMAKAQQQILLIGLLTTASGGIVAFLLATFISSPIKRITNATEKVAKGNLDPQLEIKRNDEIGTLASAFNKMTEDLQKTTVSKDYFDNIIESMNDTLVVVSVDGKIKDVNKAICQLLEYSEDELVGKDIDLIVPQEEKFFSNPGFQGLIEQAIPVNREIDYLAKSGRRIPMLFSAAVLKSKGEKIEGVVCIARDITDRKLFEAALKESEERSQAKFKGVPIPTYTWQNTGNDFVLVDYNDAAFEITKGKVSDYIGASMNEMYKDKLEIREDMWKCYNEKTIVRAEVVYKFESTDKAGIFNTHYSFAPPNLVLVHTEEITDQKRAEEALRRSEGELRFLSSQLLKAQEEERRRLSIELHDELGQDLMVLKLKMRAIQERMLDESIHLKTECDEVISFINEVAENVRRLSRDLSPSILEDLGLTAAIRWLVDSFAKHSNIEIMLDMTEINNLFSQEGQIAIYRVMQECLTNIAKHSHASSVSIGIKKMDEDVIFNIEDDGRGFNAQGAFVRDPGMKGLGLAAMHERIRILGGLMYIISDKDAGTKVIFSIPLSIGAREG
jgi:PAS domain S-box-containing protein